VSQSQDGELFRAFRGGGRVRMPRDVARDIRSGSSSFSGGPDWSAARRKKPRAARPAAGAPHPTRALRRRIVLRLRDLVPAEAASVVRGAKGLQAPAAETPLAQYAGELLTRFTAAELGHLLGDLDEAVAAGGGDGPLHAPAPRSTPKRSLLDTLRALVRR
jgi:hypothetical protein